MLCQINPKTQENWRLPEKNQTKHLTGLKVNNTLSPNKLVEFIPEKGKQVKLYICGPTVYTSSHIGHARTYISADIIKRILTHYFNYDVVHAMNITDIDDKIIQRSNEQGEQFTLFAKKYEMEFWEDMESLNVSKPDIVTRVSEFVPEIVKYIQQIIENGYAYESNGSVYFDVNTFHNSPYHQYAKLDPSRSDDIQIIQEAEEALQFQGNEKRSIRDFALWKASKPGEPFWESPWGNGRPGWHIECSAMASEVLGYPIDIHLGGEDLKFPHHDNEIAQSEAYYNHKCGNQWVNYFIHTGHLYIKGCVMSRSKKNFFTIKDILTESNSRVIRLLFMKQSYDSIMDYSISSFEEAKVKDKRFYEFFTTISGIILQEEINTSQKWTRREFELRETLTQKQENIHKHFSRNFDIPNVMKEIDELITEVNIYIKSQPYIHLLLRSVFNYVKHIFNVLGLDYEIKQTITPSFVKTVNVISTLRNEIRASKKEIAQISNSALKAKKILEEIVSKSDNNQNTLEAIKIAKEFIEQVIKQAQNNQFKLIMKECDNIRDQKLILINVGIEDGKLGESSIWKIEDSQVLAEKVNLLKKAHEEKEKKQQEKEELMNIKPNEMFRLNPKYKSYTFDENGIPTHNELGIPLKDKAVQSLNRQWSTQKEQYEKYLNKQKHN